MQLQFATSTAAILWTLVAVLLSALTGYLNAKPRRPTWHMLLFLPSGFAIGQGAWTHVGVAAFTWFLIFALTFGLAYNLQNRLEKTNAHAR